MKIKEITDKNLWENFLRECSPKTFLQSWNWGEFNKLMKQKIWRSGIYDGDELVATTLVIKVKAKRGTFLVIPHGPNIKNAKCQMPNVKCEDKKSKLEILKIILKELKEIAKVEKASFIRICPIWEGSQENKRIFKELGFRKAPIFIHPEVNWILNIQNSEEELLAGMRKTTRYLIRQALKNPEIEIKKSKDLKDVEIFNKIYQETAERHRFVPFSLNYLKNEFLAFEPDNQILTFLGKYKGEVISGAMIIFWQDSAFYHQGASLPKYPKIPVSYLLQWEAIREAKNRGCKYYNFWGIAPTNKPNHSWKGLTLFKTGFGGQREEYVITQDLILSDKYWFTFFVEKIRRIKRRV
jgi:lipid II:glycine glycyltransferase (peptidoglycan interpeptide bridge formation enzyme)